VVPSVSTVAPTRLTLVIKLDQRILVCFILYSLYAPHPIGINPFKSVLYNTFVKERDQAVKTARVGAVNENEQLVWVLWKILKGDGNDVSTVFVVSLDNSDRNDQIGPYSPSTLARSPLPPKLRASNLTLEEESYKGDPYDTYAYAFSTFSNIRPR
jgi:hypothetical protein